MFPFDFSFMGETLTFDAMTAAGLFLALVSFSGFMTALLRNAPLLARGYGELPGNGQQEQVMPRSR